VSISSGDPGGPPAKGQKAARSTNRICAWLLPRSQLWANVSERAGDAFSLDPEIGLHAGPLWPATSQYRT
jgi:hypothetical protein